MSEIGRQTNAGLEGSAEPMSGPPENKTCLNVYWDLTNLASQVQMMSDSLAACKQMSKYRPLRKMYGTKANPKPDPTVPHSSVQVLLSPNQTTADGRFEDEKHNLSVSYVVKETQKLTKSLTDSDESDSCQHERDSLRCESCNSIMEESWELLKKSSKIHLYNHLKVETSRMINVIQRDLKTLMELVPSVTSLVTALTDTVSHYEKCGRCNEKISPSLPWILNRIQKLIKYVTTKRQGSYRWPNDLSYLRLRPTESTSSVQAFPPKVSRKFLPKFEKVNTITPSEDIPGVQLLLEVKPNKIHKRFFHQAEKYSAPAWEPFRNFFVQLWEPNSIPVVQVLVPSRKPRILLDEKREAAAVREFAYALRLVFAFRLGFLASLFILSPVARVTKTPQLDQTESTSSQEQSIQSEKKTSAEPPLKQGECKSGEKTVRQSENLSKRPNDKAPNSPRNLIERVPEIVREFLLEAEAEKMHDQRVQDLEVRVKGLKDLMAEVETKQVELSKVLLNHGVYSERIIKLTDPGLLEKENEVVKRVAEHQMPGSKRDTVETLLMAVEDVKHKCDLKHRMIMIIMKGLRSNIPKEWWEDMVEYILDGSKPIEEFDPGKLSDSVEQASCLPGKGVKESRLQARALRKEDNSSEEEPIVKGNVGADVEEYLKNHSLYDEVMAKTKDASAADDSEEFSARIVAAFPATFNPNTVIVTPIRKLEQQISLLNTTNDRLRQEVQDLKNLLRNSVNDLQDRGISCVDLSQQSAILQPPIRASGKTINLTIQIVDKDFRRLNDGVFPNTMNLSDTSVTDGLRRRSRIPVVRPLGAESLTDIKESEDEDSNPDPDLGHVSKGSTCTIRCKSDRRRSENDLNSLDDASSTVTDYRQQSEKLRSVLRERAFGHQVVLGTPHPSDHELTKKSKPVVWVPSKYIIPEVSDRHQPGPSRKSVDVGSLLKKPSVMELAGSENPGKFSLMANERELQTIPENDCSSPSESSSKGMSRAIQHLRTKVRSIHQDVMVLKSKNDRIDKLLDRLTEDALENSENFEEMEENFNRLKHQLG